MPRRTRKKPQRNVEKAVGEECVATPGEELSMVNPPPVETVEEIPHLEEAQASQAHESSGAIEEQFDMPPPQEHAFDINEYLDTLSPPELIKVRDLAEKKRQAKLKAAKAKFLEEMKGRLNEHGLTLKDVFPERGGRKGKYITRVKYRSPNGEEWTGRGVVPKWLRALVEEGHSKEEYAVTQG